MAERDADRDEKGRRQTDRLSDCLTTMTELKASMSRASLPHIAGPLLPAADLPSLAHTAHTALLS